MVNFYSSLFHGTNSLNCVNHQEPHGMKEMMKLVFRQRLFICVQHVCECLACLLCMRLLTCVVCCHQLTPQQDKQQWNRLKLLPAMTLQQQNH